MLVDLLFGLPIPDAALFLGVFLPYSRKSEHEADFIGLRLMARACYDPAGAPSMLSKLHRQEKQMEAAAGGGALRLPAFLRTHPLTEDRVDRVKKVRQLGD